MFSSREEVLNYVEHGNRGAGEREMEEREQ